MRALCAACETASCWKARGSDLAWTAAVRTAAWTEAVAQEEGGEARPPMMVPLTRREDCSTLVGGKGG